VRLRFLRRAWPAFVSMTLALMATATAVLGKWLQSLVSLGRVCLDCLHGRPGYPGDQVMALTLEAEQRMESVSMIKFYEADAAAWFAIRKQKNSSRGAFLTVH
jgi:hypothetical protein